MAKLNHSAQLTIGGKVAGSWGASVGAIRAGAKSIKKEISGLKEEQSKVTRELRATEAAAAKAGIEGSEGVAALTREHKRLKGQQTIVELQLKKAQKEAAKLGKDGSDAIDALAFTLEELDRKERDVIKHLDDARKVAAKLGVEGSKDVAKLREAHAGVSNAIDGHARRLKTLKAWEKLDVGNRTTDALKRIGGGLWTVTKYAGAATAALTATAVGGVAWFAKGAIEAAASMEQLRAALETTEGSSAKADAAMKWITKFATQTPYELDQVGEAYARLRAYGIDPTDGTLKTLGDTASSMGKDLMSSVEAIADAVTGENERLKEFGIRASKAGGYITYFYKNAEDKDVKKRVKNQQEVIRATIMSIWNDKYAGAMEKQSRTWNGLMASLSRQWTQFQVRVMQGGVFDLLKGKAEQLLTQVNKWAEDGTLERWARQIGDSFKWAFDRVSEGFEWTRAHWPEIQEGFREGARVAKEAASWIYRVGKSLSDAVGGPENLAKGLALLGAAKVLSPLGSLAKVGWDIVAWLSRATGLTGQLETGLGRAGGALKGAAQAAPGRAMAAGTAARGAVNALGGAVGLGGTVAGASAGTIAGVIVGGAAIGAAIGMAIDKGFEVYTGKSLSTRTGEWLSSDVDRQRAALLSETTTHRSAARGGGTSSTVNDQRYFNINITAQGPDAEEVATRVEKKLGRSLRDRGASSYGGWP